MRARLAAIGWPGHASGPAVTVDAPRYAPVAPNTVVDGGVVHELILKARRGDREAFADLARLTSHRLFAIAIRVVRDQSRAEDCLQDALLTIWRDLRALRDPHRFDAWATRIRLRICYREAKRQRGLPTTAAGFPPDLGQPDDPYAMIAERDALDRAFGRLSPSERAVLVLRHYLELEPAEIAEILGVPAGTVRSRVHYALRALRAALAAEARRVQREVL